MGGTTAEVADTSNELLQFEMLSKGTPKVTTPILWSEDSVGDVIILDYADDEKIVFHGYFGLFVYDLRKENITLAVDLNQAV